jgi:hypothetical protein
MKNYLILTLLLLFSSSIFAQNLPDIPLKKGMAYYTFEHKLDNTSKCLSSYFDAPFSSVTLLPLYQKIILLSQKFTVDAKKRGEKGIMGYYLTGFMTTRKGINLNCTDTIKKGGSSFEVHMSGEILWRPAFIELLRKKVIGQTLTGNISVVFLSKSEYKLIIKDIVYNVQWMQGVNQGIDIYKLGEYYEKTKSSTKIGKHEVEFFTFIDFLIKSADEMILNALTDTYEADEL